MEAHKRRKLLSPFSAGRNLVTTATTTTHSEVNVSNDGAVATTSSTGINAQSTTNTTLGTVAVSASSEETETVISALLSLGSDLPPLGENITANNAALMPINPAKSVEDQTPSTSSENQPITSTKKN